MPKIPIHPDICFLGETNFRNAQKRFGIKTDDRRRHVYLIGKTGMGKSTVLENMVIQDIYNNRGFALVDPHGDLVEKVLKFIPSNRINDVIYFNPSDIDFPIAFNVLEKVDPQYRHLVASGLVGVFKKIWAESWGPRLEYLLRNAILALLDYQDATLLGIPRILVDTTFRKKVIAKIEDPVVKAFWVDEFSKYNQQFLTEAISPIQNKVGQFLSSSLIRNIVGQVHSTIDLRQVMDGGKILLLNLSKGRIGEDNSALLGAMMITKLQLAAMSRVDIPEETRRDFYLYVDEFQNFATESFANILSEARKYRLNLIIAHQYIEQLGEVVKPAVFGNVGTMIVFRIGANDAEELLKEFEPYYTEEHLVNLPKYNFYIKLMIDGVSSIPFSSSGMQPFSGNTGNVNKVIVGTRERYSSTRADVEDKIRRWSGMVTPEAEGIKDDERKRKKRNKKKVKKIEKLLPEYEKLAALGQAEAIKIVGQLKHAQTELAANKDVDLGAIIGRENDDTDQDDLEDEVEVAVTASSVRSTPRPPERRERTFQADTRVKRESFEITCDECGKRESIHFKPNPDKPIYCKNCLEKRRARAKASPERSPRRSVTPEKKEPENIVPLSQIKTHTVPLKEPKKLKKQESEPQESLKDLEL
jgi:CxxC-x17-CxxC domain-containing protein